MKKILTYALLFAICITTTSIVCSDTLPKQLMIINGGPYVHQAILLKVKHVLTDAPDSEDTWHLLDSQFAQAHQEYIGHNPPKTGTLYFGFDTHGRAKMIHEQWRQQSAK